MSGSGVDLVCYPDIWEIKVWLGLHKKFTFNLALCTSKSYALQDFKEVRANMVA